MSRPSKNTDKLLIKTGRILLPKYGSSGLNIRMVAAKAKVNLGMFHYYFKSKDEFIKIVLQEIYEEFFKEFNLESSTHEKSIDNLKSSIFIIGKFIRDNRELLTMLIKDAINGDKAVREFVKANFIRHGKVIINLINAAQNEGSISKISIPNLITPIMASVAGPIIMAEMAGKVEKNFILNNLVLKTISRLLISDEAIQQRIDLIFNGILNYGREKC